MSVRIRDMASNDIDDVIRIEQDLYTRPWEKQHLTERIGNPAAYSRVIEDGSILGYCIGVITVDDMTVERISVQRKSQRSGLGGVMMKDIVVHAGRMKCASLWLEVKVTNTVAIRLYEKYNFKIAGERKNYYAATHENAYIMKKELL